jgi:hypothetical protein
MSVEKSPGSSRRRGVHGALCLAATGEVREVAIIRPPALNAVAITGAAVLAPGLVGD